MEEQPLQQTAPEPQVAPTPPPNYIGNTGIIDRSNSPANSPQPGPFLREGMGVNNTSPASGNRYRSAISAFAEAKVLICGLVSSTSYMLIIYLVKSDWLVKNDWVMMVISACLAFAAIFFAIREYRASSQITPLTVIGLSAATITLVFLANFLVLQALVRSIFGGYGF